MAQANQYGSPPPFLKGGIGLTPKGMEALNAWFQFLLDGLPIAGDETVEIISLPGMGRAISSNFVDVLTAGGGATITPLMLLNASDGDTPGIRVVYGTVGTLVPSGMSPGDDPPFILTGMTGTGYVYAELDTDSDGLPVSASLAYDTAVPTNNDPNGDGTSANFYFEVGSYTVDSETGAITVAQNVSGSQAYQYCDGPLWGLI